MFHIDEMLKDKFRFRHVTLWILVKTKNKTQKKEHEKQSNLMNNLDYLCIFLTHLAKDNVSLVWQGELLP
jgi:hypothetical protein